MFMSLSVWVGASLGMIVAVGLSSLQHCDMSSSRNLFIVGLSLFTGLTVSQWMSANQSTIQTGVHVFFVRFTMWRLESCTEQECIPINSEPILAVPI